jgi:C_GCAxxG_C_C family probable redox protein
VSRQLGTENEIIPRIASGFGGGIGGTGAVCGAVTGAVMAIGLEHGRDFEVEDRLGAWRLAQEFRRRFEAEMGHIGCRELTGADLSTEEGRKQYRSSDRPIYVCLRAGGIAYEIVLDLLKEAEEPVATPLSNGTES